MRSSFLLIDIDCNTDCAAGDFTADLTVDLDGTWLASVAVQLFVDNGDMIWSASNQHGGERHYNVLKSTYDLKLVQCPQIFDMANVNCTGDTCAAANPNQILTVDLSGTWLASVAVQLYVDGGGLIWSASNQHGGMRTYNVLPDTYDLRLVQGPMILDVADVNCEGGDCNAGDVITNLNVDLNGTWLASVAVQLFVDDGGMIWSASNQHGGLRSYNVLPGSYDLKLVQGAKTLDVANVNCTGEECDAGDFVANLAIELCGTWPASIAAPPHLNDAIPNSTGAIIWSASNQHGALRNYNVLKSFYDVRLSMGANAACHGGLGQWVPAWYYAPFRLGFQHWLPVLQLLL